MTTKARIHDFVNTRCPEVTSVPLLGSAAHIFVDAAPDREGANQDTALIIEIPPRQAVLAVADGFGGQPSGAEASRLAIAAIRKTITAGKFPSDGLRGEILDGFERANEAVVGLGVGAATTLAVVEINKGRARTYHVGDSQVAVFGQRGKLKLRTVAHSPVGYAQEAGVIDEDEAMHHEDRHVVSNMVGSAEMRIDIGPWVSLSAFDTIVIGSDGLFDNMHLEDVVDSLRVGNLKKSLSRVAETCAVRMASPNGDAPSKPDDISVIAFRRGRRTKPTSE